MKKFSKQKIFWFTAAFLLIGSVSIHSTMAYFTTYVTAKGGHPITLGNMTKIEEKVEDMTKHITISNTGKSDCYVRVKVFCGNRFTINFAAEKDEQNEVYWKQEGNDGYWYYRDVLSAGEKTKVLLAKIDTPKDLKESFDVIVIQECTPVLYDENGKPYADWSKKADTKTDIGTVPGEEADKE